MTKNTAYRYNGKEEIAADPRLTTAHGSTLLLTQQTHDDI